MSVPTLTHRPAAQAAEGLADHYDVVVVGAGPSGLTTAVALARGGVSVLVVEKHRGLSRFPKATGLRPRTMEILRGWGLEAAVLAAARPARLTMALTPTLSVPATEVSLGLPADDVLAQVSPCRIAICPQDRLEALLLDDLVERGGKVRFSTTCRDLVADDDGVTLRLSTSDAELVVRADYVVAADGARSAVRERLGIPWTELGSEGNHLSALFHADLSALVPTPPHVLTVTVAPGCEGIFVATGEQHRWVYDLEWHPEHGETPADWPRERIAARIRAAAGDPDLEPRITGVFPWDFGAAVAGRQRDGRVFLVGDAAHRTTPRGATGMNTGIADGHNLGWKLAWVVRGWADEELLDTYEQERAAVGRANAAASLSTAVGARPDDALAHDFGVVLTSSSISGTGPLVGRRAPHAWLREGVSTIDLFDGRFTVLTGEDGRRWQEVAAELARSGLPVSTHGLAGSTAGRAAAAAYGLAATGCVLVRPDGFVAWATADGSDVVPEDLRHALAVAVGRSLAVAGRSPAGAS